MKTAQGVEKCQKTGKKKSSYAQAKKEARYLKYNKKYPGFIPVAYKCTGKNNCGWWHTGNTV